MAAIKKTAPKKAKAAVKKPTTAVAAKASTPAKRAPRKQSAAAAQVNEKETTFTLALVSLFAVLSVLFAVMAYWRYQL